MTTYTNESLQSIKKKDMISIVLSLQNKLNQVNSKVLAKIHKLSDNFSKLESKLCVQNKLILFYYIDLQIWNIRAKLMLSIGDRNVWK